MPGRGSPLDIRDGNNWGGRRATDGSVVAPRSPRLGLASTIEKPRRPPSGRTRVATGAWCVFTATLSFDTLTYAR
jgi:hypothetical protein